MALSSTIYTFDLSLSDMDRGVYENLNLRVARHPSESLEYMLSRLLAYCLEYQEGIAFGMGLAEADEPAVWVRDATGQIQLWIDVGAPDAERLHKASKRAERVAIYTHRDPTMVLRNLAGKQIHRADQIMLYAFERSLLEALGQRVERRTTLAFTRTEDQLYLDIGGTTIQSSMQQQPIV